MQNLAGDNEATLAAVTELRAAGVDPVASVNQDHETRAQVDGEFAVGPYVFRLVRRWAYWSARVVPAIPVEKALALNAAPGPGGGTHYSGGGGNLGAVARAHGFAGGMDEQMVREWGPCDSWHIDTPSGLAAFVAWCRSNLQA